MRYRLLFLVAVVGLLVCGLTYADIPKLINFQGRLTDATGKFVPDGYYSVMFRIYTDSIGGSAKWSETQSVAVSKGLFNVILGSVTPIPDSIFNYPNTWLGIQVGADPEMTPRQRLSGLGYAYRGAKADTSSYSLNSDKLDGLDASAFSSPSTDFGRSGVATDLYEGATTLTEKYVNTQGPDSVVVTSGTALKGKASGSSSSSMAGFKGHADNTSTGNAYGGWFETSSSGTGGHYGVLGAAYGSSSAFTTGSYGLAENISTGTAIGGYFAVFSSGTGQHWGVSGQAYGSSSNSTVGCYGSALNTSTGDACGGAFYADSSGTGTKYGVYTQAPISQGWAGYFEGNVRITDSLVVLGTKSVAAKMNNGEYRLLYCQESPENWFEDFGGGKLQNGSTTIQIDPLFAQTVNTNVPYHVFLTPDGDCNGLYVINKTPTSFEVRELQGGTSNISFSYRIVAKRKGYENLRLAKMGGPTPEEVAAEQVKVKAELEKGRVERPDTKPEEIELR